MLDADLAELDGVTTKALIQAVKRNVGRFPSAFMFQINNHEVARLRSQIVTSNGRGFFSRPRQLLRSQRSFHPESRTAT